MNIQQIVSGISLAAILGFAMLVPVQSQAEERRHGHNEQRYEQRGHSNDRDTHRQHRRHNSKHYRYDHYRHAYSHRRHSRHDNRHYPRVCRLPRHHNYRRHEHHPRHDEDRNIHGRVRYNTPDDWRVVFKF